VGLTRESEKKEGKSVGCFLALIFGGPFAALSNFCLKKRILFWVDFCLKKRRPTHSPPPPLDCVYRVFGFRNKGVKKHETIFPLQLKKVHLAAGLVILFPPPFFSSPRGSVVRDFFIALLGVS
jgi:hypothetical protein